MTKTSEGNSTARLAEYTFQVSRRSFFFPPRHVAIGVGDISARYESFLNVEFRKIIDQNFTNAWQGPEYEHGLAKLKAFIDANAVLTGMFDIGLTEDNIRVKFQGADMAEKSVRLLARGFYRFFKVNSKTLSELAYVVAPDQIQEALPEPS